MVIVDLIWQGEEARVWHDKFICCRTIEDQSLGHLWAFSYINGSTCHQRSALNGSIGRQTRKDIWLVYAIPGDILNPIHWVHKWHTETHRDRISLIACKSLKITKTFRAFSLLHSCLLFGNNESIYDGQLVQLCNPIRHQREALNSQDIWPGLVAMWNCMSPASTTTGNLR